MRRFGVGLGILLLGAMVLSPAVAVLGLDPVPGDLALGMGHSHLAIPVTYSLCASMGLTLLYCVMKG
ncbi:MAG TPA: hypothetical protein VHX99_07900 [Rhizomicrobium sp.]|jgi:hypothetical protein|nr:hypothetical protein [Rhizomicrobium sp.]